MIEHSLKNNGRKVIETTQYNHNFFVIDHEVVGPGVATRFRFLPNAARGLKNGAEIQGQEITYTRELKKGESVFTELEGFDNTVADYDFRIENWRSGAGVRISANVPLAKMNFWSIHTVACPEPYVNLRIEPGRESQWKIVYDFYTIPKGK